MIAGYSAHGNKTRLLTLAVVRRWTGCNNAGSVAWLKAIGSGLTNRTSPNGIQTGFQNSKIDQGFLASDTNGPKMFRAAAAHHIAILRDGVTASVFRGFAYAVDDEELYRDVFHRVQPEPELLSNCAEHRRSRAFGGLIAWRPDESEIIESP